MPRFLVIVLLGLLAIIAPARADDDLEAEIDRIEQLSIKAPWRTVQARIDALAPERGKLTTAQRQRLEYIHWRGVALSGDQETALQGLVDLLGHDLAEPLRSRVYATGISVAANVEDWSHAFNWLNTALASLPQSSFDSANLLGAASYVYGLVGEFDKARELASQALLRAQDSNSPDLLCRAYGDLGLAEERLGEYVASSDWRHRQIETCSSTGDALFAAIGKYGVGKMEAMQGRHAAALDWLGRALADYDVAGYTVGIADASLAIAGSLIELDREPERAQKLLTQALQIFRKQGSAYAAVGEVERLLARLAERRGDLEAALSHTREALVQIERADRNDRLRRVAFLQVQFDSRVKQQQIALLESERETAALRETATRRRVLLMLFGLVGLLLAAVLLGILLRRLSRERHRYRWQSQHDGLTGLLNYQQVRKQGEAAFARARANGEPFCAIVIDIDLFKEVNDRHGHAAGDEALQALGGWISDVAGLRNITGRSGGDEFTILLQGHAAQAEALLQQLRDRITPLEVFGKAFRFTISAGICEADAQMSNYTQLIHAADLALYRAKHEGRDRDASGQNPLAAESGGLVVVGSGIEFGRHASERCLSEIRAAQTVFCVVDPLALAMIRSMRPDAIDLGVHYAEGKDRRETYREIDAAIMAAVRAGQRVCAVFYGHPGVFADVPHRVIRKAHAEGFSARMEPGISAEACLYADLGIDPGQRGVQSMEATQLLAHDRTLDPAGLVLLWQVALSGDLQCNRLHADPAGLQALVERLARWYAPDHEVILYEAAQSPIHSPRADRVALRDLPGARFDLCTTLVIPPVAHA